MKSIIEQHRQDFNEIRRLCLICHGLDLTSKSLFTDSTYDGRSTDTEIVLQNMISGGLLNLAVALRINIYQKKLTGYSDENISSCVFYYEEPDLISELITIKDVCDKIIHADSVSLDALPKEITGDAKPCMQLKGTYRKKEWTLDISLELFTEAVLNFLDKLENEHT